MEKKELQEEMNYLDRVEGIIRHRLKKLHEEKALLKEQVIHRRKEMWDDNRHLIRDFDDVILLSAQDAEVNLAEDEYGRNEQEIQRLSKMEKSPYFGRLDFEDPTTGDRDTIYIGIYSLTEKESHAIYVVDWRAPISSMFYQFDLGPAWYEVHGNKVEVVVTKKRQYRVEDGRLLHAYDTDSSMYDNILGEVLSGHSDHKLKVIVGSIQKEQNLAIRSDTRRSCLIYGLAGSGKTSIGLHRLAYILYCNRDTIKSENILILSNNSIFASYLSAILPDLGERPAETKVFADLLEAYMDQGMVIEDYYSQLKRLESSYAGERAKGLRILYSPDLIRYCTDYFAAFPFRIPEIRYGEEILLSPESFQDRLDTRKFPSFQARFEMLGQLVKKTVEEFFLLHKDEIYNDLMESHEDILSEKEWNLLYKKTRQTYIESAQEEILRQNRLDPQAQAVKVLSDYLDRTGKGDEIAARLSDSLNRRKLLYEEALFYLFVKVLMGKAAPFPTIRHTVIDESQDYSLLQLSIIKHLLPKSSFTLLGDIYQAVNSLTTIRDYNDYTQVFGPDLAQIRLGKCYRSSGDINALAFELINEAHRPITECYSYFHRTVRKPQYLICKDILSCLVPILEGLGQYHSIAVIVDNDEDALAVKSRLQGHQEAQLILSPDDEMTGHLVIIPLLLAKGLEFDAVILFNCIYSNLGNDRMRQKVYLGCTRALHELYFVERDILPDSLQGYRQYLEIRA